MEDTLRTLHYELNKRTAERFKQSIRFKDSIFSSFRVDLKMAYSLFQGKEIQGPKYFKEIFSDQIKSIFGLFSALLDACEYSRNFDVACMIVRSIADRIGVLYFLSAPRTEGENELRLLLYARDSFKKELGLQLSDMKEEGLMDIVSDETFLEKRCRFLKEKIQEIDSVLTNNCFVKKNPDLYQDIIEKSNWKFKDGKKSRGYSWKEIHEFISSNKIPGIETHYCNLAQQVHGLYCSRFKLPPDNGSTYRIPLVLAMNLLFCLMSFLQHRL